MATTTGITMLAITPPEKPLSVEGFALGTGRSEDGASVPNLKREDKEVSCRSVDCDNTVRWFSAEIPPEVVLPWTSSPSLFALVGK